MKAVNSYLFNNGVKQIANCLCKRSISVDSTNLLRFDELSKTANEWMNEHSGAFKALHSLNTLRIPWIVENMSMGNINSDFPLLGQRILDVGSGGGLISMALCRLGAEVVGLDACANTVKVAELTSKNILKPEQLNRLCFVNSTLEDYVLENAEGFDAIVASEIVEHVTDLPDFIYNCVQLAKTNTPLFFTTINKTYLSRIFAIWEVLSLAPKGVHEYEKFVTPNTLRQLLYEQNCRVGHPIGMAYNPFNNKWSWTNFVPINYALVAFKR